VGFRWIEDVGNGRDVDRFVRNGELKIASYYDMADDGEDGRLMCIHCCQECDLPKAVREMTFE
jgi:hypothetical protein